MLGQFYSWWLTNIAEPYAVFVWVQNLGWSTTIVAVVTTILLGLFYKPHPNSIHGPFMEKYVFPASILVVLTFLLPTLSVAVMFLMPAILIIGGCIGGLMCIFLLLQKRAINE